MAYDPKNIKVEVESLNKRHPKKGITSDIPEEAREQLEKERREREFTKGEKNRYVKGGYVRAADGYAARQDQRENGMRKRRFNEGGSFDEDERPAPTGMSEATKLEPEKAESKKPKSFKEAFAAAEDGSTFEWNGKKYKKEYAKPTAAPAPAPKASAPAPKASAPAPAPKASAPASKTSAPAPAPKEERDTYTWSGGKRILAKIGTQAQREKYKAEGYAKGGSVSSASSRADGCAVRGKTRGKIV